MSGGTFTITNPGVFGALIGTPIIPEGQVAILDVEAIVKRPVVVTDEHGNDAIAIRSMMFLCLSYDHRLVDGAYAAQFMAQLKQNLETGTRARSGCDPGVLREPRGHAVPTALAEMTQLAAARSQWAMPDTVLVLEHEPVITLGSRADRAAELPLSDEEYAARGIEIVEVPRGGRSTYHGPGQLVGYPILDLNPAEGSARVRAQARAVMIATLADFGIEGHALDQPHASRRVGGDRKIASIGVRCARWVTSHGFSLNADLDLGVYELFDACGLGGAGSRRSPSRRPGRDRR